MNIAVNGESSNFDVERATVTELLELCEVESPDMVSVQLNGEILERKSFDTTSIADGDEVEFLYFMGGGSGA